MLLSKTAKVQWTKRNYKWYQNLGYVFTKYHDEFEVKIEDLTQYATCEVSIQCDYCKIIFPRKWNAHNNNYTNDYVQKDACLHCSNKKRKEANAIKYNDENYTPLEVRKKVSKSNKTPYDMIKYAFEKRGYIIVTTEEEYYSKIDKRNTIYYICPKHEENGILHIAWDDFINRNKGCKYCAKDNMRLFNSHFWKGGEGSLVQYLRDQLDDWKKESMQISDFKCVITGERFDVIHHLYSFNDIIDETLKTLNLKRKLQVKDYSIDEIESITKIILERHNELLGVCLRRDIHELFHAKYGNKNNRPYQFKEFVNKYRNNEFNLKECSL